MPSSAFRSALCFWGASFPLAKASSDLSFLIIGDWGGGDDDMPASPGETCNAAGMAKVASELNAQFVLAVGDNFYDSGIHADNLGRFKSTFDDVFTGSSLDVDWFVIAGNHDHRGNVSYQLDFSKQSTRWKFPSLYYSFAKSLPSGKVVQFVMFDSVVAAGMGEMDSETGEILAASGPEDAEEAAKQWKWVEAQLANSQADYLFTAAHYPVWSGCSHGNTQNLIDNLLPLMRKYSVTGHFAGHDHCLEHMEDDSGFHVLSGAGSVRDGWYKLENKEALPASVKLKFYLADDNYQHYKVKYYGDDGTLLFTSDPHPPRGNNVIFG